MTTLPPKLSLLAALLAVASAPAHAAGKRCLFVNSYHAGYPWSDAVESALKKELAGKCELTVEYMDLKRRAEAEHGAAEGKRLSARIDALKPDVLIASDDPASHWLVQPYLKGKALPVVFCGVNWSGDEYGYPYPNATGMIEVFPLRQIGELIRAVSKGKGKGIYLGPDTETDRKTGLHGAKLFTKLGLVLEERYVKDMAGWEKELLQASGTLDYVLISTIVGLSDPDAERARRFVRKNAERLKNVLVVTWLDFSAPFTMVAITEIAEEQGEYAGQLAAKILSGAKPADFPVVPNQRWRILANPDLLAKAGITLPADIMAKAEKLKD